MVLGTFAALAVVLPRLAETRDHAQAAILGHRELVISVTALVAAVRMHQTGEVFVAVVAFAVLAPVVMAARRLRLGALSPRRLARRTWALQAGNYWLFLALLAVAGLSGTLWIWHVFAPGAHGLLVTAFWVGLAAAAVLVAVPRRRLSAAANVLTALGSAFLAVQLVAVVAPPAQPVSIGVPTTEEWQVASGGRSGLVNSHGAVGVQRDAIDFVQLVDGRTYSGDRSRLEHFHIFGDPVLAVADGLVVAAVDGHADLPVGGRTWEDMTGNHVVLDIGGGRYVAYGHLQQGSLAVRVGNLVRRGQHIARVGDSGNSDEPHLHLQVQNAPELDVESRELRTYPMLFEGVTEPDLRRGDSLRAIDPGSR